MKDVTHAIPQGSSSKHFEPIYSRMSGRKGNGDGSGSNGEAPSQPPAIVVLTQIMRDQFTIHQAPGGKPFATSRERPSVYMTMSDLAGELTIAYFVRHGRPAPTQPLNEVIRMAEAIAKLRIPVAPSIRIAGHGGYLYLDLGRPDGWAVEIGPDGWQVVPVPPVIFVRTAMTSPLPLPAERGSAEEMRDLINIQGDDEWALYIACRIASLLPGITHPVEVFTGPAGSAKTFTTRMTSQWIDPSESMIPVPRDGRTWATVASGSYCLPVDNISYIPGWWSDLLCKAASGDGWIDRALYTDGEIFVSKFQAVVMLNGITLGSLRGDLADRMVLHKLTPPSRFMAEDVLDSIWERCHPEALAWLLDQTVAVLRVLQSSGQPDGSHRLARFEQVVQIVDRLWGTRAAEAWRSSRTEIAQDVVEADVVSVAVQAAIQMPARMTSAELVNHLTLYGGLRELQGRVWTPRLLSEHLGRAITPLTALGWQMWRDRISGGNRQRQWVLIPPGWFWDGSQWMYDTAGKESLDTV